MNKFTEGDATTETHAEACRKYDCMMCCRCWCHGILKHLNGKLRADAKATVSRERPELDWLDLRGEYERLAKEAQET